MQRLPAPRLAVFLLCGMFAAAFPPDAMAVVQADSPLEDLTRALASEDVNDWSRATTFLGLLGEKAKPAVPALVKALDRAPVRESALAALRDIGPAAEEAVPALIRAFTAYPEQPACRWVAAEALARIGEKAVPALDQAAQSPDATAKVWACAALAAFEGPGCQRLQVLDSCLLGNDPVAARETVEAVKMLGPKAASLAADLNEALVGSTLPRRDVVEALQRIGPQAAVALPEVIKSLDDTDPLTRIEAIRTVGAIGGPGARDALPKLIQALAANDKSDAFIALQQPRVRAEAAQTLSGLGPDARAAVPELIRLFDDPDEGVRVAALAAIRRISPTDPGALPVIIKAMRDPSFRVQTAALESLLDMGPVNIDAIRAVIHEVREHASSFSSEGNYIGPAMNIVPVSQEFFDSLGPEHRYAIPDLVALAADAHPGVQRVAVDALVNIGDVPEELIPMLLSRWQKDGVYWACEALIKLGPRAKACAPKIIETFKAGDPAQRASAARLLASIGRSAADPAIPLLERALQEPNARNQSWCAALLQLDPASTVALDTLEKWAAVPGRAPDQTLYENSLLVKYGRNASQHLQVLIDALNNADSEASATAARSILEVSKDPDARKQAINRVLSLIDTESDSRVRGMAAYAFFLLTPADGEVLPRLLSLADRLGKSTDVSSQNELVSTVAGIGKLGSVAQSAVPTLRQLLNHDNRRVCTAAKAAMLAVGQADPSAR